MEMRFPTLTPVVKRLLIALVACFVAQVGLERYAEVPIVRWLALSPAPSIGWAWQWLTQVLVYPSGGGDSLLGFVVSLFFLYVMLSPFEERYGGARTAQLALAGTAGASVASMLLAVVLRLLGLRMGPVAGADALVLAALGAFAASVRDGRVLFLFAVPMKTWHLIALGLGLAVLRTFSTGDPSVLATYAGAIVAGLLFVKWMLRPRRPEKKKTDAPARKPRATGPQLRVIRGGGETEPDDDDRPRWLN
ncbi:MAG: rhomboid family intramembrane serine protease [Sandaracinaceae bacterium]|nr:rhomboid family intramembrane serine protease [Sandaracinaceae bacterium]